MSPPPLASSWRYRPELDGLRALAVGLVLLFHARVAGFGGGFIGVDVFFVLSGFLVTNVLLREVDERGTFSLSSFYARRVRRLLPAAVVVIVSVSVLFVLIASLPERLTYVRQGQAALVYLANWQFIAESNDYFVEDAAASPFMHFWSLSVEEQFYIVFPLLLLLLLRFLPRRGRRLLLLVVLSGLAALSVWSQLHFAEVDPARAYFATDSRVYQPLAGAVLAVALRGLGSGRRRSLPRPGRGGLVALAGLVGLGVLVPAEVSLSQAERGLLATLAAMLLVGGLYRGGGTLVARAFALPVPVYLGKISYGIYLWHWPMVLIIDELFDVRNLVVAVLAAVAASAVAALSYQILETPIRRAPRLDSVPWGTVLAGVTVSVLAATSVVAPVLESQRKPVTATAGPETSTLVRELDSPVLRRQLNRPVPGDLDFAAIANDRGPADVWCSAESPEDCLMVDGEGPHVLLVGDSHARVLAPALERLAEEKGFRLSGRLLPGCPWLADVYNGGSPPETEANCRESGEDFYTDTIRAIDPDVVIVASLDRGESWDGRLVDPDGEPIPWPEGAADAVRHTADLVSAAGADLVIVHSMVGTGGWEDGPDPLDCLARADHLGDCAVARPSRYPLVDSFYDTVAASDEQVATIDINGLVCPTGAICAPMMDGEVVWRNFNHFTAQVVVQVREQVWQQLEDTGFL